MERKKEPEEEGGGSQLGRGRVSTTLATCPAPRRLASAGQVFEPRASPCPLPFTLPFAHPALLTALSYPSPCS